MSMTGKLNTKPVLLIPKRDIAGSGRPYERNGVDGSDFVESGANKANPRRTEL